MNNFENIKDISVRITNIHETIQGNSFDRDDALLCTFDGLTRCPENVLQSLYDLKKDRFNIVENSSELFEIDDCINDVWKLIKGKSELDYDTAKFISLEICGIMRDYAPYDFYDEDVVDIFNNVMHNPKNALFDLYEVRQDVNEDYDDNITARIDNVIECLWGNVTK